MKNKIAIIGLKGLPAFGGAATVGENIIEQLKDVYDFTVYAITSHTHLNTGNFNGFRQIVFKKIQPKKLNVLYYYIVSALHAIFLAKYSLVHIHHRDASFIIPLLRIKYKVVLTTHGMVLTEKWSKYNFLFRLQDMIFLRMANCITCVSKKDLLITQSYKKNNVYYIPNGITPSNLKSSSIVGGNILFAAGRIVPSKGCHILLEALNRINYVGPLKIVGDQKQMSIYIKNLIQLSQFLNVEFTGLIKDKNTLYEIISAAKIFVYPSRIESMSMMLLEVASLKIPIICSDIKENQDVFNDSEVLFFRTDDVLDLSDKIIWALQNDSLMLEKAERALQKLEKNHNWNSIALDYEKVYKSVMQID